MTTAAIAEIEELIMVQEVHEGDLQQVGAAIEQSGEEELPPPAVGLDFWCKYCDKKFKNKQALGGHQNGHRIERAMDPEMIAKRIRRCGFMDYGFLHPHFAGFSSFSGDQVNWPEIPTSPPYAYPFPPAVVETSSSQILQMSQPSWPPVENHSPLPQVSPPAMTVSGASTLPGVPGCSIVSNSDPGNTPAEIIKDGELDLSLKL